MLRSSYLLWIVTTRWLALQWRSLRLREKRKKYRLPKSGSAFAYLFLGFSLVTASAVLHAQSTRYLPPIISLILEEVNNKLKAIPTNRLNDTGITKGMDLNGLVFNDTCVAEAPGAQDCNYGNDLQLNSNGDGFAGFSFTFVDDQGELQEPQDKNSACAVLDNVTGLMWDSGRPQAGLKSPDATYSWFISSSEPIFNSLFSDGQANTCPGYVAGNSASFCNTEAYIARLNAARWCGHNDWRLPTMTELTGLQQYNDGSANGIQNWLSSDHFFAVPESWSSNLFLFDGFLANPSTGYFLHVAGLTADNATTVSGLILRSDRPTSVLVVRND